MGYRATEWVHRKRVYDERLKNLGGGNYWKELLDRLPAKDIFSFTRMYFKDKTKSV